MRKKHILVRLLYIIIILLILFACTSKKKKDEKALENEIDLIWDREENKEKDESRADPFHKRRGDEDDESDDTGEILELEQVESEIETSYSIGAKKYLSFLPQIPGSSIKPEDFSIGSLYNSEDASREVSLIKKIISDFLDSMGKSQIEASLLYEGEGSELYRRLVFHLENNRVPRKYRIGTIIIEDMNTGYTPVRLFGQKGRSSGEIYVRKKQDNWCISDVQINFYDLEVPVEKNEGKFLPTTYHWIIQGM